MASRSAGEPGRSPARDLSGCDESSNRERGREREEGEVEVNFEVIASAVGTGSVICGGFAAWFQLTIKSTLAAFREDLFRQMNGKYIPRELADERFSGLKDRVERVEGKVNGSSR